MGPGFIIELNKFSKYHCDTSSSAEEQFRKALDGLNAQNVGQRIEQFYQFLLRERERLRRDGKSSGMIVKVNSSAFIISLFAYWLDPAGEPLVYYEGVRKGLYILIKAQILTVPHGLAMGPKSIEVGTEADHKACVQLVADIATQVPQVKNRHLLGRIFFLLDYAAFPVPYRAD